MDRETRRSYIAIRFTKARDDLITARDDTQRGHWRGAANRAYYAVFHVASAALLWLDIERARHSGTQAAFNEFLVKPGKIETEFGKIYSRARKMREAQNYDLLAAPLTQEDAEQIVADAERFLTRLERYLREAGAMQ